MAGLKVAVGLGNPGARYAGTRHNAGFLAADRLAHGTVGSWASEARYAWARVGVGPVDLLVVKPTTFMNDSGLAVADILQRYEVSLQDILVLTDDIHLELGRVRVRRRGSDGGHNGLASIIRTAGGGDFARLRLGIGAPPEGATLIDYVLSKFRPAESEGVARLTQNGADAALCWAGEGVDAAMNRFNGL